MTTPSGSIRANLVDIAARRVFAAEIGWAAGVIGRIDELGGANPAWPCLIPGFIDAHVHIESSLLPPAEFARLAVRHGTVASVSDPHEIANVLGLDGVTGTLAPGLRAAIAMEDRNQVLCTRGGDFNEGIRAFLEKRRPVYGQAE